MHKIIGILCTFTILQCASLTAFSQTQQPLWSIDMQTQSRWFYQSRFGLLIICNEKGLHAIDPDKKAVVWSAPDFVISSSQFTEPRDFPLIEIRELNTKKKGGLLQKAEKRFAFLDPLTGKTLFDSELIDVERITKRAFMPGLNAVWIEGVKDDQRMMGVVDIGDQKTRWLKPKPVQLKKMTLFDILKPVVDPENNIVFVYSGKFYRVNGMTGEIIWQKDYTMGGLFFSPDGQRLFGYNNSFAMYDLATGNYLKGDTSKIHLSEEEELKMVTANMSSKDTTMTAEKVLEFPGKWEIIGNEFLMSNGAAFNLYDFKTLQGKWKQTSIIKSAGIQSVFPQADGSILVLLSNREGLGFARMSAGGEYLYKYPASVKGYKFRYLKMTGQYAAFVTAQEAGFIDLVTGKVQVSFQMTPETPYLYTHDTVNNKLGIYQNRNIYVIDRQTKTVKHVDQLPALAPEDADLTPRIFHSTGEGFFIASNNDFRVYNLYGDKMESRNYKITVPVSKGWQITKLITAAAAGILLRNDVGNLRGEALEKGIITFDQAVTGGLLDYHVRGVGVAANVFDALTDLEKKMFTKSATASNFNKTYLLLARDKEGNTRIVQIDKRTGAELKNIALPDKEDDFQGDPTGNGVYVIGAKNLYYYSLQ